MKNMNLRLLKSKRVLNGLTQEQIARKIGINPKSYNMKELGKSPISLEEASKLSEILKLTIEEFMDIFLQIKLSNNK